MSGTNEKFDPQLYTKFASMKKPEETVPRHLYVWHNHRSLVIQEERPKSKMHFKLIPRVNAPPKVPDNLKNLHTLLLSREVGREDAEKILREIQEDAETFKKIVEEEMVRMYGFSWGIWMGFPTPPSYEYLHLHIISDDLTGEFLKKPNHFFRFHPELGRFYHLDEVIFWFEIVPERFEANVRELLQRIETRNPDTQGEALECYMKDNGLECCFEAKNLPKMKEHLKEHWEKRRKAADKRKEAREKYERRAEERRARLEAKAKEADGQGNTEGEARQSSPDKGETDQTD